MFINEMKKVLQRKKRKKRGRGIPYIYKNRIYLGKKTSNRYWSSFSSHHTSIRKRWRRYWILMFKKKYRRKSNRKFKRKYKRKIRRRGFGDGFKLLCSLGKQWHKSMQ